MKFRSHKPKVNRRLVNLSPQFIAKRRLNVGSLQFGSMISHSERQLRLRAQPASDAPSTPQLRRLSLSCAVFAPAALINARRFASATHRLRHGSLDKHKRPTGTVAAVVRNNIARRALKFVTTGRSLSGRQVDTTGSKRSTITGLNDDRPCPTVHRANTNNWLA